MRVRNRHRSKLRCTYVAGAVLVLAAIAGCSESSSSDSKVSLAVVDKAGYEQAVSRHRGRVVLVDFWATWCGPCKEKFPHAVELYRRHHDQGLDAISISCDEPEQQDAVLAFLKQQGASFENLLVQGGIELVDNGALPHYRLYDREGRLVRSFNSGDPDNVFTDQHIDAAVAELLARQSP